MVRVFDYLEKVTYVLFKFGMFGNLGLGRWLLFRGGVGRGWLGSFVFICLYLSRFRS